MTGAKRTAGAILGCVMLLGAGRLEAQDWPQWRGPNRDAIASGFKAPKTWPKELTQKWKVTVGDGVATPSLVGDRLYVFAREDGKEIIRCLDVANGKEQWQDSYESEGASGPARNFSGPRCSPTVADGKVVILGVRGALSCYDAASGKKLWRKDDIKSVPMFCTSSSPLVADGLVVAQLGGRSDGAIVAYDLASGTEKWKWTGGSPAYASPSLLTVGDTKAVVAETSSKIVAVGLADGKLLWETNFKTRYNASSPFVDGQTVLYAGQSLGTKAVKLEKKDGGLADKELWSNKSSVQYNTPVVLNGLVYGLSDRDSLFCIDAKDGKTLWTAALGATSGGGGGGGGGGKGRKGGMGGGRGGYGSIVAAGDVLMALTPAGRLVVFEASPKAFKKIADYKVADGGTYAYPVVSGNRVFIKDRNAVTLYVIEG